ncbi:MAG: outer membrane beta-barrel protein [Prevotellaceae bacterium]|jgi:hypothetical protein|nr:outer membrane beta-barrel protein [Prevotellaceae bacterium]
MKYNYIIILMAAFIGWSGALQAQETDLEQPVDAGKLRRHELSANIGGGIQSLTFQLANRGVSAAGFSGGGGIGYAFHISRLLSVGTGVGIAHYGGSAEYNVLSSQIFRQSGARFTYYIGGYREELSTLLLEIPLLLRFSIAIGDKGQALRFAGGVRFGLPVSARYDCTVAKHKTQSALLEYENVEYEFDVIFPPNAPVPISESGKVRLNAPFQITAEIAYRLPLSSRSAISVGAYFGYGLNDMQATKKKPLVTYSTLENDLNTSPPKYTYTGSVLNTGFASSIRTLAIGLKVQVELLY